MLYDSYQHTNGAQSHTFNGSCLDLFDVEGMRQWLYRFDFIFADPPFNIGHDYDVYDDVQDDNAHYGFIMQWCGTICKALRPGGIACIHIPDAMVHRVIGSMTGDHSAKQIEWLIWHYRFGQCQRVKFTPSKAHCLVFRQPLHWFLQDKDADGDNRATVQVQHTFNADAVLVESDRSSTYGDARTQETATPGLRTPLDVFGVAPDDKEYWGRIQGNNKEKVAGHPNQLPEVYLQRLLAAYTNPSDWVLDMFGGTGTTATVGVAMGRNCMTVELSEPYCRDIIARVRSGPIRF